MKVLVTGGSGFIGSNVVKLLEKQGAKTYILDDFSHSDFRNLLDVRGEIICSDILEENIFNKLPKIDSVIHLAAVTDTTLTDDTKMMMVNFNGFKNVLNFCIKKNIKLVYASSAATYGDGSSPMKENQEPRPLNTYAYSKYLCDCYMKKLKDKNYPLIVGLRYFNVYGPGEKHKNKSASMIYQLYLQMKENKSPRVFKFGEQKRDFIYVKDAASITIAALNLKKNTILNVGTGKARSFNDIISSLNKNLGKNLSADYFDNPYMGVYQNNTEADIESLRKLKLTPQFSLESGIEDYVQKLAG